MSVTTYSSSLSVDNITVSNTYESCDLISKAASLVPSTVNASIINQWLTKTIKPTSFSSNLFLYSTLFNISAATVYYSTGILAQDGRFFFPSYGQTNVGVYNPKTKSFTTISGASSAAYFGGTLMQDGRIFLSSYGATRVGLVNPITNVFTSGPAYNASPGNLWTGCCTAPDGRVVQAAAAENKYAVGVYDPVTNTFTSFTGNGWQGAGTTYPYDGATLIPDGRIIFSPHGVNHIGIFNYLTNSFTSFTFAGTSGFSGGVYHPNGNVYFSCDNGTGGIGIFNTVTNSFTTQPGTTNGFRSLCLLPDGRIFLAPSNSAYTFTNIFNPYTGVITTVTGIPTGGSIGCNPMSNGNVLLPPWAKVQFGIISGSVATSSEFYTHPFYNRGI